MSDKIYGVPLKRSLSISYSKQLSSYIQTAYHLDPQPFAPSIEELDNLRTAACAPATPPSSQTVHCLVNYWAQLRQLMTRFPLTDDITGLKIPFSWLNFGGKERDRRPMACYDARYEEAAIVFNIAAVYTQLATMENIDSVDGLKKACNHLMISAGAFSYVVNLTRSLSLPTNCDLLETPINVLQQLVLAEAQECFVRKAILDKTVKDSTLAKLAYSTGALYEAAQQAAISANATSPHLFDEYLDYMAGKVVLYRSMAHYRKSSEFLITSQYGREIVKLQEADEQIKQAKDLVKKLPAGDLLSQINALTVSITKNLERALKDNSVIYHDPVPSRGSWGDCGTAVVVRPINFPDSNISAISDSVVFCLSSLPELKNSIKAHELAQQKTNLLESEHSRLNNIFSTLEIAFANGNISSICQAADNELSDNSLGNNVPEDIAAKSDQIKSFGGYNQLEELRGKLGDIRVECSGMLYSIKNNLEEEQKMDLEAQERFKKNWNRPKSAQINQLLWKRYRELEGTFEQASKSDEAMENLFESAIPSIIMLCYTLDELSEAIPTSNSRNRLDQSLLALVENMRFALTTKDSLEVEKDRLQGELYQLILNSDDEGNEDKNLSEVLNDLKRILNDKIEDSILQWDLKVQEEVRLIERLSAEWTMAMKKNNSKSMGEKTREQVIADLNSAAEAFQILHKQLNDGLQFYTNFKGHVGQLNMTVSEFVRSRKEEYGNIVRMLTAPPPPTYYTQPPPPPFSQHHPSPNQWNPSMPVNYGYVNHPPMQNMAYPPPSYHPPQQYGYPPNVSPAYPNQYSSSTPPPPQHSHPSYPYAPPPVPPRPPH